MASAANVPFPSPDEYILFSTAGTPDNDAINERAVYVAPECPDFRKDKR